MGLGVLAAISGRAPRWPRRSQLWPLADQMADNAFLSGEKGVARCLTSTFIEYHPQRVLEAFRRGEFDQIEIIGQADEKEFFELCFREKCWTPWPGDAHAAKEGGSAPLVCPGGQSESEAAPGKCLPRF